MDIAEYQTFEDIQSMRRIMYVQLNSLQTKSEACRFSMGNVSRSSQYIFKDPHQFFRDQQEIYEAELKKLYAEEENLNKIQSQILAASKVIKADLTNVLQSLGQQRHKQLTITTQIAELRQNQQLPETLSKTSHLQIDLNTQRLIIQNEATEKRRLEQLLEDRYSQLNGYLSKAATLREEINKLDNLLEKVRKLKSK